MFTPDIGQLGDLCYQHLQQTPNPAAQLPSAEPPALEHSLDVKQVPARERLSVALRSPVKVEAETGVQGLLGKVTIEKREN